MPLYEVIEGATYTIGDKVYPAGETVDLTEGQAAPWLDLTLRPAPEPALAVEPKAKKKEVVTDVNQ